jgi:hypothetical protein
MSVSGETKQDSSLAGRFARQWRDWRWRRRAITELSCHLSKRKCKHDLAAHSADPVWQDYCPNAPTLCALMAERCQRNTAQAG